MYEHFVLTIYRTFADSVIQNVRDNDMILTIRKETHRTS